MAEEQSKIGQFFKGFNRGIANYKKGNYDVTSGMEEEEDEGEESDSSFGEALAKRKKKRKKTGFGLIDALREQSGVDNPEENLNQNMRKLYFDKQKQ